MEEPKGSLESVYPTLSSSAQGGLLTSQPKNAKHPPLNTLQCLLEFQHVNIHTNILPVASPKAQNEECKDHQSGSVRA